MTELSDLVTSDQPVSKTIPVELYSRKNNRTSYLINNAADEFSVEGKHRWFDFEFEDFVFIQTIRVNTKGYDDWKEVEFEVLGIDGSQENKRVQFSNNIAEANFSKIAKSFRFRPDPMWTKFEGKEVKSVVVSGLTSEEIEVIGKSVGKLEELAAQLIEKEAALDDRDLEFSSKLSSLQKEISEARLEKGLLDTAVGQSQAKITGLEAQISSAVLQLNEQESKQVDAQVALKVLQEQRRKLESEIQKIESELERITREVRLFPSEIAGFVKEGNRSTTQFILLSIPFVAIIAYVTYALFSSAVNLTQLWQKPEGVDIWTVFLTRVPFVLVAIAILEVCGYVVGRFIFEILKINRQRLNLSKLSIIAKDVSNASANGLEMSAEEVFQNETKLKMELLREHMSEYIGEDFQYKGTAFQNAVGRLLKKASP